MNFKFTSKITIGFILVALLSLASAAAEEINRSIMNVNQVSDETAQAMKESTAAVVELARMAEKLDLVVKKLTD